MNAAGQTLLEFVLIILVFLTTVAVVSRNIPATFAQASPYLAGKIEVRLESGGGFPNRKFLPPIGGGRGGVRDQ